MFYPSWAAAKLIWLNASYIFQKKVILGRLKKIKTST
jgi:hypothetical protein